MGMFWLLKGVLLRNDKGTPEGAWERRSYSVSMPTLGLLCKAEVDGVELSRHKERSKQPLFQYGLYPRKKTNQKKAIAVV